MNHVPKKVKWSVTGASVDETDPGEGYAPYEGPIPPRSVQTLAVQYFKKALSAAGNDKIVMFATVHAPEPKSKNHKYHGCPYFDHIPVGETTRFRVRQLMDALGGTGKDFDATTIDNDDKVVAFGRIKVKPGMLIRASVKQEPYGDDVTAKIDRLLPPADKDEDAAAESPADKPAKAKKGKKKADEDPPF